MLLIGKLKGLNQYISKEVDHGCFMVKLTDLDGHIEKLKTVCTALMPLLMPGYRYDNGMPP